MEQEYLGGGCVKAFFGVEVLPELTAEPSSRNGFASQYVENNLACNFGRVDLVFAPNATYSLLARTSLKIPPLNID